MTSKYPIVLVHGVMIKDFKFFRAFGRIENVLEKKGFKVYTAKVDGLGSIENNAFELKKYIKSVMRLEKTDKVNIIAHSKGGLDSKYMIEKLNMAKNVASLTSLCTPYKGSPVASKILDLPKFMVAVISTYLNIVYKVFGDKNPDALTVGKQLKRVKSIKHECLDVKGDVYCQSYSAKMDKGSDDFIMGIPLAFSRYFNKSEKTDGLVPVSSSVFENYKGEIKGSVSHTEIVDFMVKKSKKEKIYKFYIDICVDLAKRGF